MNEWERRVIELTQNHVDLTNVAKQFGENALVEYFTYTAQIGTFAAPLLNGVTQQAVIAIQSDSWFVLEYVNTGVLIDQAVVSTSYITAAGNVQLQITDTGSGQVLYSAASIAAILAGTVSGGTPGIPLLLPIPRLIAPNTNIKIEATQLGVAAPNLEPKGFFIALSGARISQI